MQHYNLKWDCQGDFYQQNLDSEACAPSHT